MSLGGGGQRHEAWVVNAAVAGDERVDDVGVELLPGAAAQLGEGDLGGERLPVGPVRGHGVVGVGDGDDARPKGDRLPARPSG